MIRRFAPCKVLNAAMLAAAIALALFQLADRNAAKRERANLIAAALRAQLKDEAKYYASAKRGNDLKLPIPICLFGAAENFSSVARSFNDRLFVLVAGESCKSRRFQLALGTREYDEKLFDATGREAGKFTIRKVSCAEVDACLVDIDHPKYGLRYRLKKASGHWQVVSESMRWII